MKDDDVITRLANGEIPKEVSERARSITVGTCFGGTVEIGMRRQDGEHTFGVFQPVEVIELIHQLAASVGCHVALKPRTDFSSWRRWKVEPHMDAGPNWPPFVNDLEPHKTVGAQMPHALEQPGMQPALMARSENEQTVATQKTVGRKRTKRAAAAA